MHDEHFEAVNFKTGLNLEAMFVCLFVCLRERDREREKEIKISVIYFDAMFFAVQARIFVPLIIFQAPSSIFV